MFDHSWLVALFFGVLMMLFKWGVIFGLIRIRAMEPEYHHSPPSA